VQESNIADYLIAVAYQLNQHIFVLSQRTAHGPEGRVEDLPPHAEFLTGFVCPMLM
jgi:hypothetical protein